MITISKIAPSTVGPVGSENSSPSNRREVPFIADRKADEPNLGIVG